MAAVLGYLLALAMSIDALLLGALMHAAWGRWGGRATIAIRQARAWLTRTATIDNRHGGRLD